MMNIYLNQLVYLFVGKVKALYTYFLDDPLSTKQLISRIIQKNRVTQNKRSSDWFDNVKM
jgi:hypothetical protein